MTTRGPRSQHRTRRAQAALALAVATLGPVLALAGPAQAAPGDLDPTFGGGGTVTGPAGGGTAIARQGDGKLVVGGIVNTSVVNVGDWRLARYNPDGSLDTTFGSGGVVTTDRTPFDALLAVAVQADGKIVGTGYSFSADGQDFTLARYNADGTPDVTFGTGGVVITNLPAEARGDAGHALAIQGDGKIVAAAAGGDFIVARYNANGTPDNSFGSAGKVVTDFGGGTGEGAHDVAVLGDGRIVASGCAGTNASGRCHLMALARYSAAGVLDTTFAAAGKLTGPPGATSGGAGAKLAVQGDGKLVVVGTTGGTGGVPQAVALARFSPDGAPDATFDGDGVVAGPAGSGNDVAVQADGRLVVAGVRDGDFLVARFSAAGALDASFDGDGMATTDFGPGDAGASALVVQPDGRPVAAGYAVPDFALARYEVSGGGEVADVSVTLTDAPDPVDEGGDITYTLTARNNGPQSAYQVVATTTLPPGAAFAKATPSEGVCSEAAGTVTCRLNGLVSGATATVAIVAQAKAGLATASTAVTTTSSDPNGANNAASTTTTVRPGAGAWIPVPALGTPRSSPGAALADGRVLLAGGVGASAVTATAVVYDPSTGTSTATASLAAKRRQHTLTTLADGRVLAVGGDEGVNRLRSAEIWNPATGTWSSAGNMAIAHSMHTAVLLDSGKVLVVGGMDLPDNVCPAAGVPNSAELYDPATNSWSAAGGLRATRVFHTTTKLADGRVLAVGGYMPDQYRTSCATGPLQTNAPVEIYDPAANSWTLAADTAQRRNRHGAVRLADGSVLVSGGNPCNGRCPTNSVERYDPATGTWSLDSGRFLAQPRFNHAMVRLANGKVLAFAGEGPQSSSGGNTYPRSTELYDPTTDRWAAAGLMAAGRAGMADAPHTFNRALALGGDLNGTNTGLSSVERWTPRPTVTSLSPTSGGPGTVVTLTGTGLASVDRATFGTAATAAITPDAATPDTKVTVVSPGSLDAAGGAVDVTVSGPGGPSAVTASTRFTHPAVGYIRATTNPAVPAQVTIDGLAADTWGTNWVAVPAGSHTVCFRRDIEGFTTPGCQSVTVAAGQTTAVEGAYARRGFLQVGTSPCCLGDATISLKGPADAAPIARDNHTLYTDLAPGTYRVCWGPVANLSPPACRDVAVTAGQLTTAIGDYTASPGAPGPAASEGMLRVTTSPAVPAQITVDGIARDTWSLEWLRIAPGSHTVCFARDIEGFTTPGCQTVNVTSGQTTTVQGTYVPRGFLQVGTDPCCQSGAVISVDGVVRDNATVYTDLAPATYRVCWGALPDRVAPACRSVAVTAGALTTVIGTYASG